MFRDRRERAASGARGRSTSVEALEVGAVAGLTVLAFLIRLPTLGSQSLWLDETLTAHDVGGSLGNLFGALANNELTPPLYFLVAWLWAHVVGTSEVALRSFSVVFGTATVPLAYVIGRKLASRWAGYFAAAFATTSAELVWFSQEARSYALFVFLAGLTIVLFLRVREQTTVGRVVAWGAASEAALLCHYFAGFLVALEALWLLRTSRRWVSWTIAVFALTEAALVPLAVHQARAWPPPHSHGIQPRAIATNAFLSFATNEYPIRHPLLVAAAVSVVALVFVGFGTARERRGFSVALLLAAPTLLLPLLAPAAGHGIYYDRHLMGAWPPLAAALAVALSVRRLRFLGAVVAAVICAGSLVLVVRSDRRPALQRDDWRDAFASLGPARTTRAIVTNWNYERYPLRYYRPGATQMRPAGRAVAELDLVGVGEPPPVSPPPGFRLVARRHVQHLTVVRYVAAAPILVSRSLLRPAGSLPRRIGVFVEEPSRTQRTRGSRSSAATRSNSVQVESTRTTPVPPAE